MLALNTFAEKFNRDNADAIESCEMQAKPYFSAELIEKASGIKNRYVISKVR
ncbi:hypothetical protein [Microbulbifer sp. Q7]|uniref:hypothetical protein n=1 Tax=Microbulbifer sp. Q7 TaxID=1785091 RepID=UPI000B15ED01|nr:hypothetical protein [Microbulbifer sp. Q7]